PLSARSSEQYLYYHVILPASITNFESYNIFFSINACLSCDDVYLRPIPSAILLSAFAAQKISYHGSQ
ncbi:MAG TPA: hypothetical protein DHD79_04475, partial [Firmicutes bacterium]|nr:hypothetical protein [Bacillota bacterium]HCX70480.1 hypothetical protein [Bacillota bacterium]